MTIQQTKKRSNAIDMVKGLSILTLFFLHIEQGFLSLDCNIFLVRSPAFYIIVGWLWGMSSNRRSVKEHWKKRLQGLVKPYIYFSLIFLAFDIITILFQLQKVDILYRDIYKTICLRGIGTLWFLPALLGGEILFLYLRTKKTYIRILTLIIAFILLVQLNYVTSFINNIIATPLKPFQDICYAYIYISSAYFLSRKFGKQLLSNNKITLLIVGSILLTIDFYIMNFTISSIISFLIGNYFAGIGIILIFTAIENFKPLSSPLVYCGKNSLIIMATHYSIIFQTIYIIDKKILGYELYSGDRTIFYFVIAVFLQIAIIELINKKMPFIIGK